MKSSLVYVTHSGGSGSPQIFLLMRTDASVSPDTTAFGICREGAESCSWQTGKMVVALIGSTPSFLLDRALIVYAMAAKAILAASVKVVVLYVGMADELVSRANSPGVPASASTGNALFRSWIHEVAFNPKWVIFV